MYIWTIVSILTPGWHGNVLPVSFHQTRRRLTSDRLSVQWWHWAHVAGMALFIAEIFARWRLLSAERPAKSSVRRTIVFNRVTRLIMHQLLHTQTTHTVHTSSPVYVAAAGDDVIMRCNYVRILSRRHHRPTCSLEMDIESIHKPRPISGTGTR